MGLNPGYLLKSFLLYLSADFIAHSGLNFTLDSYWWFLEIIEFDFQVFLGCSMGQNIEMAETIGRVDFSSSVRMICEDLNK